MKTLDRFWNKVFIPFDATINECWLWLGATNQYGYGTFALHHRLNIYSHRYIYGVFKSEIPIKMKVLHSCDNPKCVNPSHLFLGTQKDNVRDMINKGRSGLKQHKQIS